MNLKIDLENCTGCGVCVDLCPGDVLRVDEEGFPFEKYPYDCWYCGVCMVECPVQCISLQFPYLIR